MHKCINLTEKNRGFVLPTVLVVSIIMLSALTLSLTVVWSSRQALKEQFDLQNSRNAAISGINVADGCRYGNDIVISDTITASVSPLGNIDCGRTAATVSSNPFILKTEYGNASTSFGFSANYLKDSAGVPTSIASTSGSKGRADGLYSKQAKPSNAKADVYVPPSDNIQTIGELNCPDKRTRYIDARDGNSYWVQRLGDGFCWMLTNLAYGGGGDNAYGDVIPVGSGSGISLAGPDNTGVTTYVQAKYYNPPGSNPTNRFEQPSTAIDGGVNVLTSQFGYLYNWCAAMGAQYTTSACSSNSTPAPNMSISICPAGWRLPNGANQLSDFKLLNTVVNSSSTTSDAGLIVNPAMFQRGGMWYSAASGPGSFVSQGEIGYYWSNTQASANAAYGLYLSPTNVATSFSYVNKYGGFAVRCIAN